MKKILLFIMILLFPVSLFSQFTGSGTWQSPYSGGTLTSNLTWDPSSDTIYVSGDLTIGNSGHLTITSAGEIFVKFMSSGADIIITGTGRLSADGTPSAKITFTADFDKDKNHGEAGERWGHISFQNMTTTNPENYPSIIDNCIIEYGQKNSTPFNFESSGGGIQTAFTYLTISNSIIRNNYAGWGGGIYVNANSSPIINNCIITNNSSGTTGGGISFFQYSASVVENCIIYKNTCTGNGGGGGVFIGDYAGDVRFYNSTIASNTSTVSNSGDNIRLWPNSPTTRPKFYNTIVWGSNNSINYIGSTPSATDFNNCAIQGYTSGYTNCINLDGTNNNQNGPNFYNVTSGSEDYRIYFISPCRDAGAITSPTVPNDYAGNPRVGRYDIGAYEVQYNCWKTTASSTDWATAGNWDGGVPTSSSNVVIPTGATNYPTGSASQNHTIGSGYQMVVEQGACVTLGTLTNNGTLKLYSTTDGTASLIVTTYSKGGGATEEIQLFLTGGGTKTPLTYKWHYISSPVTSLAVSTFAPAYTLDLAQWVEPRPSTSLTQGWVAYDGYIYSTGGMGGPTFSTLDPGKGYDFFDTADNTFTFGGQLNTGDVNATLSYKSGNDNLWGYNLIGNPFTSGLDWDYIITHSFPANTTKSLYFTRNSVLCSYIAGVGVPGDVTPIIPPMQGFFSKTYSAGNIIVLAAAARTHTNIHARYKGSQIIPLVRLALTDDSLSDETVVRFDNEAKSYLDNDFDAVKMFLSTDQASIYSSMAGIDYAINGLPFPVDYTGVPVTVNIATDTTLHTIRATQLQGLLDKYDVFLVDRAVNDSVNLGINPSLTFSASKGTISGRFILKFYIKTGIEVPVIPERKFNIYPANSRINIQTLADEWNGKTGSVRVLDITGKTVSNLPKTEYWKNSLIQVEAPASKGIYIVELKSGLMRYAGKIIIR